MTDPKEVNLFHALKKMHRETHVGGDPPPKGGKKPKKGDEGNIQDSAVGVNKVFTVDTGEAAVDSLSPIILSVPRKK